MPTLDCYLLRKDGEWFSLGRRHYWHASFTTFPGPIDGSVTLKAEDTHLLGLRLDSEFQLAADIIKWANGQSFKFRTELDPEHPPDGPPSPITGRFLG